LGALFFLILLATIRTMAAKTIIISSISFFIHSSSVSLHPHHLGKWAWLNLA
jgi:hypothetical protein